MNRFLAHFNTFSAELSSLCVEKKIDYNLGRQCEYSNLLIWVLK